MAYKRKVTTKQEGITGQDEQFGELKMLAKSKRLMPIIFAIVMAIFALAIFAFGDIRISEHPIVTVMGFLFILIAILQLCTITDKIEFYEFGLINYSFLNRKQKRLAYDDIEAIVEAKHVQFFQKNSNPRVAMWKIYPKNGKGSVIIDATGYIGISNIMISVRHDTKIKNISD